MALTNEQNFSEGIVGGTYLGNGVEAGKCTVYYEISQEHHFGFYRKEIGEKMECVLVGIYPFGKKKKKQRI